MHERKKRQWMELLLWQSTRSQACIDCSPIVCRRRRKKRKKNEKLNRVIKLQGFQFWLLLPVHSFRFRYKSVDRHVDVLFFYLFGHLFPVTNISVEEKNTIFVEYALEKNRFICYIWRARWGTSLVLSSLFTSFIFSFFLFLERLSKWKTK